MRLNFFRIHKERPKRAPGDEGDEDEISSQRRQAVAARTAPSPHYI
jgi:hypothetical protein